MGLNIFNGFQTFAINTLNETQTTAFLASGELFKLSPKASDKTRNLKWQDVPSSSYTFPALDLASLIFSKKPWFSFRRKYFLIIIWVLGMITATVLVSFRSFQWTKQKNFMCLYILDFVWK